MTSKNVINKPSSSSSSQQPELVFVTSAGRQSYTNKNQFRTMIGFIEENRSYFRIGMAGMATRNKQELARKRLKWEELKEKLNAIGPPFLETDKWKRVWNDYKYSVRNKIKKSIESKTGRLLMSDEEIRTAEWLNIFPFGNHKKRKYNLVGDDIHSIGEIDDEQDPNFVSDCILKSKRIKIDKAAKETKSLSSHSLPTTQSFMPLLMKQMESQTLCLQDICETIKDMKSIKVEHLNIQKKVHKLKKDLIATNEE